MTITKNTFRPELDIAIIGMAGRFPGAQDIKAFWENLKNGIESIAFFSDQELKEMGYRSSKLENPDLVRAKGVLEDVEYFDASFFGYTPAEAETMDPQIRMLHHYTWNALEDAGYVPDTFEGLIGLYVGATNSTAWQIRTIFSGVDSDVVGLAASQLSDKDHISTRISHKLNLRGPSFTLSTQCSTSLVAFHLACQGLLSGECDMALAGGVCVSIPVKSIYIYQEEMVYSRDGHCRVFDANANGTVFGNGVGLVVLKRIENAIESNDHIYALVKGTAINNDGGRRAGYSAPGVEGQAEVIRTALQVSEVEPENIGYIETHGTGTLLGDPIEIEALKLAFNTNKKKFCPIGSVKSNLGHLDVAAGITGVIKTTLALNHRLIPPSLHFEMVNPNIDFDDSPFYVNKELKSWESHNSLLRAGVSSFGIGGTNAHVVLEEWPHAHGVQRTAHSEERPAGNLVEGAWNQGRGGISPPSPSLEYQLILLSAKTESELDKMTENLSEFFKKNLLNRGNHENPTNPGPTLADAAYTLQVGRKAFNYRRMVVCPGINEAIAALQTTGQQAQENSQTLTFRAKERKPYLVFMFSGLGSQYVNMGWELYRGEPLFRESMDRCFTILASLGGPIKDILYPGNNHSLNSLERKEQDKINHIFYSGLIKFSFDYSMAKLLMKWGILPDVMIGHSFGEYVAACLAGVFSLEDALKLMTARGEILEQMPEGAMLGVPLSEEEIKPYVQANNELSLAAVNSSSFCIVSGSKEAIDALSKQLTEKGYECVHLNVPRAGHSKMMDPFLPAFRERISPILMHPPQVPYISCITGKLITAEQATDPGYWTRHMRETVRFVDGIDELIKKSNVIFIQVGCGRGLTLYVNQHPGKKPDHLIINLVRSQKEDISDMFYLFNQIGKLWLRGQEINWHEFYPGRKPRRISLPTYPFAGQRYWKYVDQYLKNKDQPQRNRQGPLKKNQEMAQWFYVPTWERSVIQPAAFTTVITSDTKGNPSQPCWLVFMDACGIGTQLVNKLAAKGKEQERQIIQVNHGHEFRQVNNREFTIDPGQYDHYTMLFDRLQQLEKTPHKIAHLWGLTGNRHREKELDPALIKETLDLGFYSLLYLAKLISKRGITHEVRVDVVTDNLQEVNGEEQLRPEKSLVLGPVKVIPQEYANIVCRSIDVVLPEPGSCRETRLIDQLLVEFESTPSGMMIAYRGNYRWVQSYKQVCLDEDLETRFSLREKGVYLVTGGLGLIGLILAEYLAKIGHGDVRLILTGRSTFPPREEWEKWLSPEKEKHPLSVKIKKLQEIEKMGAQLMVCSADTANLEQMQAVISRAEKQWGPINGVIHSAGIVGGETVKLIDKIGKSDCEQQFRPKVLGLLVLETLFKQKPLDFCMMMSSMAAILGGLSFTAYSAANIFMDYFVYRLHRESSTRWLSVNWDGWLPGDEPDRSPSTSIGASLVELSMTPEEATRAFRRILGWDGSVQVLQSAGDLQLRLDRWIRLKTLREQEQIDEEAGNEKSTVSIYAKPRPNLSAPYIEPSSQLEQTLAEFWKKLFDYDRVGVCDDFFQLGGDSLKAITVIANIHKKVDVKIPLAEIFKYPTIREIAGFIKSKQKEKYVSIKPLEKRSYYDVSYAQNRVWVLSQIEEASVAFNMITANLLEGDLDKQAFDKSFVTLVERHESLRTIFVPVEGKVKQKVLSADEINFKVDFVDLKGWKVPVRKSREKKIMVQEAKTPFDLSKGPLLKVILIRHQDRKYLFLFNMHHIIGDLLSNSVINREILTLYNAYRKGEDNLLKPLRIHYKDYAAWQNRQLTGEYLEQHREYWLRQFKLPSPAPVLQLPIDKPRPEMQTYNGNLLGYTIVDPLASALRTLSNQQDATMFMTFLAALNVLMYQYTNQTDIVIGTPIAGREHADLENQIGFYLNTLALRTCFAEDDTFLTLLAKVKKVTWGAFEHQDFPFDKLVQELGEKRDVSRHPLFDVMLDMAKLTSLDPLTPLTPTKNPKSKLDLKMMPAKTGYRSCKFDLTVYIFEEKNFINMVFEYSTDLFEKSTIERMKKRFRLLLDRIVKNPHTLVADFDLEEERQIPGIDTTARSRYTL